MTKGMPEKPIGSLTPLSDPENVQLEATEQQDTESIEYAYALLSRSPLPAVTTEDEI